MFQSTRPKGATMRDCTEMPIDANVMKPFARFLDIQLPSILKNTYLFCNQGPNLRWQTRDPRQYTPTEGLRSIHWRYVGVSRLFDISRSLGYCFRGRRRASGGGRVVGTRTLTLCAKGSVRPRGLDPCLGIGLGGGA